MKRLVWLTALASTPALPCTLVISEDPALHPDVRDGRDLPTNVQLFAGPSPFGGVRGTLTSEDGAVVDLATDASPLGGVELAPNTRYVWSRPFGGDLTLTIGAGRDDDAPAAPTLRVEGERVEDSQPWWERIGSDCGYVPAHTAFTIATGDVSAAIAAVHTDGTFLAVGRGVVTVRDFEDSLGGVVDVVAIDAAGNTSDAVAVELVPPGGCAQTSSTSTAMALALAGLVLARRRH